VYDIAQDARRFVMTMPRAAASTHKLVLVLNGFEQLRAGAQ
jgi:hypothetical protein